MSNIEFIDLILIPALIGILEAVKKTGFNPKFIPILSIILGVLLGIIYSGFNISEGILAGIFIGLTSIGMYSGIKNTLEGIKQFRKEG